MTLFPAALALSLTLPASPAPAASPGVGGVPAVAASSYVVVDADSGEVLAARDPHGRYLPASTLKTLTAATLIPRLDPGATVKPSARAVHTVPTTIGLKTTKAYKVADLFRAMLMISANDAAVAVAEAGGGVRRTVSLMNARARELGAADTLAGSPNGLDNDYGLTVRTQHSSAYDLALIFRAGLSIPAFRTYVGTSQVKTAAWGRLVTHDKLLSGPLAYPGLIGGKTGFTTAAAQNFVGAATRGGHTIIIAEMHSTNAFWGDARTLFDWGFAHDGRVAPVTSLPAMSSPATPEATPTAAAPARLVARTVHSGLSTEALGALTAAGATVLALAAWTARRLRRPVGRRGKG